MKYVHYTLTNNQNKRVGCMRFVKMWLCIVVCMLSWNTVANAGVLFNAENYPVGAPIGRSLVIQQNSAKTMKYATVGSSLLSSGDISWNVIESSFEFATKIYCEGANLRSCEIKLTLTTNQPVMNGNASFEVKISSSFGTATVELIEYQGIVTSTVKANTTKWITRDWNTLNISVNGGIAKLYINNTLSLTYPFRTIKQDATYKTLKCSLSNDGVSYLHDANVIGNPTTNTSSPSTTSSNINGISTNGFVSPTYKMTAGIAISGGTKRTLVRAMSVDGLVDPVVEIYTHPEHKLLSSNDSWSTSPFATELTRKGLAPTRATDAATIVNLPSGLFTMEVSSKNGKSGLNIVEVYDMAVFP